MTLWHKLGYKDNPYSVDPLQPTSEGAALFVGRDRELRRLITQLSSTDTHPTIEGDNGVGKTSLAFVAAYRAAQSFFAGETTQLLFPVADPLQIGGDAQKFEREALLKILDAFLLYRDVLADEGFEVPETKDIETWLRSPVVHGGGAGGSILGVGGSVTVAKAANTSAGFSESGLRGTVKSWLTATFPHRDRGAFVLIVDNLELLQTSAEARRVLEEIRDGVLAFPGVRWVLCGAKGIVRSAVSSPRLSGRVGLPIELAPVPDDLVPELIRTRLAHHADRPDAIAPVSKAGFSYLYRISNSNLRNAMKYAQDFAMWLDETDRLGVDEATRTSLLQVWMAEVADGHTRSLDLQPVQWTLLDGLAREGGSIAPGDHRKFGFRTPQAMRSHLQRLEQAQLIDSAVDESDSRRRTISLTSVGWLVWHSRSGE